MEEDMLEWRERSEQLEERWRWDTSNLSVPAACWTEGV